MHVPMNGGVNIYDYISFGNVVELLTNVKCWFAAFVFEATLSILVRLMSFFEILCSKPEMLIKPGCDQSVKFLLSNVDNSVDNKP